MVEASKANSLYGNREENKRHYARTYLYLLISKISKGESMKEAMKKKGGKHTEDNFLKLFSDFFSDRGYQHSNANNYGINANNVKKSCYAKTFQKGIEGYFYYRRDTARGITIYYGLKTQFSSIREQSNQEMLIQLATQELIDTFNEIMQVKEKCEKDLIERKKNDELSKLQEEFNRRKEEVIAKYNKE